MMLESQMAPPLASSTLAFWVKLDTLMMPDHQTDGGVRVGDGDQPDQHAGQVVQPGPVPVDAAGVADDQDGQQDHDEDEEEPGGVAVAQLVRERRPQQARGDDGERHGPAGLAEAGPVGAALAPWRGHGPSSPTAVWDRVTAPDPPCAG